MKSIFRKTKMISTNAEIIERNKIYDVIYNGKIVGYKLKKELAYDLALNQRQLKKLDELRKNS